MSGQADIEPTPTRTYEQVLADAVGVLSEAARLQGSASQRIDWAEIVTHALAGASANIGGVEAVLAGRPGSWEADGVRHLITSTVGHDEQDLLAHRTEPVLVEIFVSEILNDLGVWGQYDQANEALVKRAQAVNPAGPDQGQQLDVIAEEEEQLELERDRTWAAYGEALTAHIQDAATRRPGLSVPVEVCIDLDTFRSTGGTTAGEGIASDLLQEALAAVPVPTPKAARRCLNAPEGLMRPRALRRLRSLSRETIRTGLPGRLSWGRHRSHRRPACSRWWVVWRTRALTCWT